MLNSLVNEVAKVMVAAPTLYKALNALFLGITEICGIKKMALFGITRSKYRLELGHSTGIKRKGFSRLHLPLDGGEYTEAIFRHRHLIIDSPLDQDPFLPLGVSSYILIPIVSRITKKCWETRNCGLTQCPCYEGNNPYCWSVPGAGLDTGANSEEEKRRVCVSCSQFKSEGLLWLDTSPPSPAVTADSISHITGLAQQAGIVMESFRMYGKLEEANEDLQTINDRLASLNCSLNKAQRKIAEELDHARAIQNSLLPRNIPLQLLRAIASRYVPAGKVGGDYYDCFELSPEKLGIVVADVSGHGIAAALIMSMFKILLKTYSVQLSSPAEVLKRINVSLVEEMNGPNFVTAFYGCFDKASRRLVYSSAGHIPQLLLSGRDEISESRVQESTMQELGAQGLFLGVFEDTMLVDQELILEEDARMVLYTDGLTEAHNAHDDVFGYDAFKKIAQSSRSALPEEALESIMSALRRFQAVEGALSADSNSGSEEARLEDDMTLVILDL